MGTNIRFRPFMPGYLRMLEKAEGVLLPITKEQQNRNLTQDSFSPVSPKRSGANEEKYWKVSSIFRRKS